MTQQELETDILSNIEHTDGMQISPILMTILTGVITGIVSHFVEQCFDKEKVSDFSNLNRIQSMFLKQAINREVRKHPELDASYGPKIYEAFVKTGKEYKSENVYSALKGTK